MVFGGGIPGVVVVSGAGGQVLLHRPKLVTLVGRGLGQVGSRMHPLPGALSDAAQSHDINSDPCASEMLNKTRRRLSRCTHVTHGLHALPAAFAGNHGPQEKTTRLCRVPWVRRWKDGRLHNNPLLACLLACWLACPARETEAQCTGNALAKDAGKRCWQWRAEQAGTMGPPLSEAESVLLLASFRLVAAGGRRFWTSRRANARHPWVDEPAARPSRGGRFSLSELFPPAICLKFSPEPHGASQARVRKRHWPPRGPCQFTPQAGQWRWTSLASTLTLNLVPVHMLPNAYCIRTLHLSAMSRWQSLQGHLSPHTLRAWGCRLGSHDICRHSAER
ncbi:hypothetical protein BT67DRAFT_80583 [Trichocladium antarcticum]|uniref:Uncharacterized protein n=1 Tax=Trichocladium antarcticum TaxID=1450529 RepID=A0AAN6UGE0_9PEZI|nr:hypothetical protein BT67DRAFT_80583 [Trichocladium antarcticum]